MEKVTPASSLVEAFQLAELAGRAAKRMDSLSPDRNSGDAGAEFQAAAAAFVDHIQDVSKMAMRSDIEPVTPKKVKRTP